MNILHINPYINKTREINFTAAIAPEIPKTEEIQSYKNDFDSIQKQLVQPAFADPQSFKKFYLDLRKLTNEVGEKAGFNKQQITPRILQTDAYYVSSNFYIHDDAKDYSAYQITFRRQQLPWMKDLGIKPEDSKLIFYGLQQIMNEVLHDPITMEEIDEADKFFKTAKNGGQFKWNREIWERVVKENHGIIPVKIEALPDGSTVFPGEPVIQITAQDGYGEMAAWFETKLLQVWANSERASLMRYILEYNKNLVKECTNENLNDKEITEKAQRMLVDFSDRSSMTPQESEWLGMGSLTVIPTTSTISAAYRAFKTNDDKHVANLSMPSIPHRVVQSYIAEKGAYWALYKFTKGGMGSYVADCYDFRRAVTNHLIPLALQADKENKAEGINTVVCARPDSGDPFEEVKFVMDQAVKAGLYKEVTAKDGKKLKAMTVLRVVQADGMKISTIKDINKRLIEAGYSPIDSVYYGVGGYLHDSLSRSNMSAAQKLCEVGLEHRPVMKCPLDEPAKESIPGKVKIVREGQDKPTIKRADEQGKNEYIIWYDGINGHGIEYKERFDIVKNRVLDDFNKYTKPKELYSTYLNELRSLLRSEHRDMTQHTEI
jgi:nicotinamide phosphoribosyltransferase